MMGRASSELSRTHCKHYARERRLTRDNARVVRRCRKYCCLSAVCFPTHTHAHHAHWTEGTGLSPFLTRTHTHTHCRDEERQWTTRVEFTVPMPAHTWLVPSRLHTFVLFKVNIKFESICQKSNLLQGICLMLLNVHQQIALSVFPGLETAVTNFTKYELVWETLHLVDRYTSCRILLLSAIHALHVR